MSKLNVIKNYLYNTAYQLLVMLAPLITMPYVSRVLGVGGVGTYSYVQSVATYFMLAGAIGTTIYGQREIAFARDDVQKRSVVFWQITLLRFIGIFLATAIYFAFFAMGQKYATMYKILTVEIVAAAFDISWFFMGLEKFKVTVIRNSIIKLIGIISVFIFIRSPEDVLIYAMCLTFPIFLGNLSLWISLPKYLVKVCVHSRDIFRHIVPAFKLFLPQLAIDVYTVLDTTMLGAFSSNIDEVGYYTQASKIIKISLMLITSLGVVMLPAMSYAFSQGKNELVQSSIKKAFRFIFMLSSAILFGICGIAKNFVPLFFGSGFDKVIVLMITLSPILLFIGMSNVLGKQYLLPTMQEKAFSISVFTGAAVNFVFNWLLIRKYDSMGAAVATVIAEFSVLLVQIIWVRKQLNLAKCFSPIFKYFVCGLIMFVVVYFTGELLSGGFVTIVVQISVGVVAYILTLAVTRDPMLREGQQILLKKIKK